MLSDKDTVPYKIVIDDIVMRVRYEKLADDIYQKTIKANAIYPIARVKVKESVIPIGGKTHNIPHFVSGELPEKIFIGIVTNDAAVGDYKKNPFNFQHFNLSELSLIVNNTVHGGTPLTFDFDDEQFESWYWSLFEASGKKFRDDGMLIERDDYKGGYALYAFDISPSVCNIGEYRDPERRGNISISCNFSKASIETLILCAYLQFNDKITVTAGKEIAISYNKP